MGKNEHVWTLGEALHRLRQFVWHDRYTLKAIEIRLLIARSGVYPLDADGLMREADVRSLGR